MPKQPSEVVDKVVDELRRRSKIATDKMRDGRWTQSMQFDKRLDRLLGEPSWGAEDAAYCLFGMATDFGHDLTAKLVNAGRHTVDLRIEKVGESYRSRSVDEYAMTADICPVRMRQMEAIELVPPKPKIKIVEKVVERVVEVLVPAPTVGERLRGWWAEMTSDVVYDGPRG